MQKFEKCKNIKRVKLIRNPKSLKKTFSSIKKTKRKFYDEEGECVACGFIGVDLHHVKHKGSGGSNGPHNLIPLCHKHHVEYHQYGMVRFTKFEFKKNGVNGEEVLLWLLEKGWYLDLFMNKFLNEKESHA